MNDTETPFSAADLEPSPQRRGAGTRAAIDRAAAAIAVLAAGLSVGGMIALGACAAPFVFRLTPAPYSGYAMGAAFARFDNIALGASAVILAAEVARTWASLRRRRALAPRLRRLAAILVSASAAYIAIVITPQINRLHQSGVTRGEGDGGAQLDAIHKRAELIGKVELIFGVALVGLHVFTIRSRSEDEDDDDDAPAPLPPGA